jgi:hypothetical protein
MPLAKIHFVEGRYDEAIGRWQASITDIFISVTR